MELHAALENVTDEKSFLHFVRLLISDRQASTKAEAINLQSPYGSEACGWENTTIESFLSASVAWAEASNFGLSQNLSPQNPWQQFATFLYCGKIYE